MAKSAKFQFGPTYDMLPATREQTMPVPVRLWRRIVKRLCEVPDDTPAYDNLASVSFGAAVTALLALLGSLPSLQFSVPGEVGPSGVKWWTVTYIIALVSITIAGIIVGFVATKFASRTRKTNQRMRDVIAEDMYFFSEPYASSECDTKEIEVQEKALAPAVASTEPTMAPGDSRLL